MHGGHVTDDDDPAKGFDNWRKAVEATDLKLPLLIENTAGGTNAMTRYLDRIAGVWEAIQSAGQADMVGFCLDTCHAHAGGNPLETIVEDVLAITGRIDLVHANDSRDDFDSGADRHANFGAGRIDPDLLAAVVRDAGAPVICETPGGADRARRRLRLAPRAALAGHCDQQVEALGALLGRVAALEAQDPAPVTHHAEHHPPGAVSARRPPARGVLEQVHAERRHGDLPVVPGRTLPEQQLEGVPTLEADDAARAGLIDGVVHGVLHGSRVRFPPHSRRRLRAA